MAEINKREMCHCGSPDCWDLGDYSWLSSRSGWHGELHGCQASVFFIHGKKIREQRHLHSGSYPIAELPNLLAKWATGLPNARLVWSTDEDGAGFWIEGEREPNADDLKRLQEVRDHEEAEGRKQFAELKKRFA